MHQSTEPFLEALLRISLLPGTFSVVAAMIVIHDGSPSVEQPAGVVVFPFVYRDVATVHLLSTAPAAWMLGQMLSKRLTKLSSCLLAALLWTIAWNGFVRFQQTAGRVHDLPAFAELIRLVTSFCITFGATLVTQSVCKASDKRRSNDLQTNILRAACCLSVLALVPRMYLDARGQHDADQYFSLRQQSRLGEASSLLNRMLMLDPGIRKNGQLLKREQRELEQSLHSLKQQLQHELPVTADFYQYLQRARGLAMLGRTQEAIRSLLENPVTFKNAEACSLLGTMYENQFHWNSALRFYEQAQMLLNSSPKSTATAAQAYQVTLGSAYCCRRLGLLREARTHYMKLLTVNPTADTHFLLAQFYEDIQETETARQHTQIAMQLDPHYRVRGSELIRKMQTLHFRCLIGYRNSATKN